MVFNHKFAANGRFLPAEFTLPKSVTQDHSRCSTTRLVIFCTEQAAFDRNHTQRREHPAANPETASVLCLGTSTELKTPICPRKYLRKSVLVIADLFPERIGEVGIRTRNDSKSVVPTSDLNHGQSLRIGDGQTAKTYGI